jgi:hypothetical protein
MKHSIRQLDKLAFEVSKEEWCKAKFSHILVNIAFSGMFSVPVRKGKASS